MSAFYRFGFDAINFRLTTTDYLISLLNWNMKMLITLTPLRTKHRTFHNFNFNILNINLKFRF